MAGHFSTLLVDAQAEDYTAQHTDLVGGAVATNAAYSAMQAATQGQLTPTQVALNVDLDAPFAALAATSQGQLMPADMAAIVGNVAGSAAPAATQGQLTPTQVAFNTGHAAVIAALAATGDTTELVSLSAPNPTEPAQQTAGSVHSPATQWGTIMNAAAPAGTGNGSHYQAVIASASAGAAAGPAPAAQGPGL